MKFKSTHRKENPRPELSPGPTIPEIKIDGVEAKPDMAVTLDISPEEEQAPAVREALEKAAEADEAANALRKQIANLQRAEKLQRQHLMSLDEKIEFWREGGLSDQEAHFLRANPEMANLPDLINYATARALHEGHERNSTDYFEAIKENFGKA